MVNRRFTLNLFVPIIITIGFKCPNPKQNLWTRFQLNIGVSLARWFISWSMNMFVKVLLSLWNQRDMSDTNLYFVFNGRVVKFHAKEINKDCQISRRMSDWRQLHVMCYQIKVNSLTKINYEQSSTVRKMPLKLVKVFFVM